jgi:hypothetical protein
LLDVNKNNFWGVFKMKLNTLVILIGSLLFSTQILAAENQRLLVELNKFEKTETGGCQAFFLFRNQTDFTLEGFEMSLAVLDNAGVIDRLLTIDAAPLPAQRTTLKLFEIPEIGCSEISEVLLHELSSCRPQNDEEMDCYPMLDLSSRTNATLVK